jgi:hypothetical protein
MNRKEEDKIKILDNDVIISITNLGWAVIIMPDNIVIDNYHDKKPHIHHYSTNHHIQEEINQTHGFLTVYNLLSNHLYKNKKIIIKLLIKELKK